MNLSDSIYEYTTVRDRAKSWMRKANRYKAHTIGSAMDGFIASYIAYAAWASLILFTPDEKKGDRRRCIDKVNELLSRSHDFKDKLDASARELAQAITHGGFDVKSSHGDDPELDEKWGTPDGLHALLCTLYNMRCNLFHGQKSMVQQQIAILKPAIACLSILNEALAQIFEEEFDRYIH